MPDFLKGNYQVPDKGQSSADGGKDRSSSLTEKFEESALAKLVRSICFVSRGTQFVWNGDDSEKNRS